MIPIALPHGYIPFWTASFPHVMSSLRISRMDVSPSRIRALRLCLLSQFVFCCLLTNVTAAAHARLQVRDSSGSNDMSTKVWVILTVLLAVSFVLLACLCSKRAIFRLFGRYATPAGQAANARELTADQLAGSINRNVNNANNANNTTNGRPRRTRRPRRTPSQISTTSLPAYMKDPGEHELVVYRGPMDLQDMPQPAAAVLFPMNEDGEQPSLSSQSTRYPQISNSSSETPLLRPSTSSDGSNNSLHRTHSNNDSSDARGDAPPYDEAIRATPMQSPLEEIDLTDPSVAPVSPIVPGQPPTQRMSGFRSFLNAMSPRLPQGIPSNDLRIGHGRTDSNASNLSSIAPASRTRSRLTHHSSPSTSSSIFGALSRQRSMRSLAQGPLNSPSVISFNSISAPLTHTLVRTDLTFPKAGPTPEQIKAISSRDATGRFGVPYGADAIAYAASTSRQDLPPDFEFATSTANLLSRIDSSASSASYLPFPTAPSGDATSGAPNPSSTPETATSAPAEVESYVRIEVDTIPQTPVDAPEEATPSSPAHAVQAPLNSSPSSPTGTHKSKQSLPLPPSSFHTPSETEFGRRNDSRMSSSSVRSYATAQESLSSTPASAYHDTFSTPLNSSPAETPKIGGQHVLGPSNASTLTPATIYAAGGSSNTDSS